MCIIVPRSHHDLVGLVSTQNEAFVDQTRCVVIDVPQVDGHGACRCGWWFTLKVQKTTKKKQRTSAIKLFLFLFFKIQQTVVLLHTIIYGRNDNSVEAIFNKGRLSVHFLNWCDFSCLVINRHPASWIAQQLISGHSRRMQQNVFSENVKIHLVPSSVYSVLALIPMNSNSVYTDLYLHCTCGYLTN